MILINSESFKICFIQDDSIHLQNCDGSKTTRLEAGPFSQTPPSLSMGRLLRYEGGVGG